MAKLPEEAKRGDEEEVALEEVSHERKERWRGVDRRQKETRRGRVR